MLPPAFSTFSLAVALMRSISILNCFVILPLPRSLTTCRCPRTSPLLRSVDSLTHEPSLKHSSKLPTLTIPTFSLKRELLKPRFGKRRINGIWPPSNPGRILPPERALCPLCPLVEVFPWPLLSPIPRRFLRCLAPGRGFKS